ncbi:RNA polymerase sigma factor [Peristeroidobacter soli]|jgi:RNA polymerase sigma factor (sigma-70 family)|uniref:RNA polymerase sigma factor n=1 Tax=Peristeroidobacter soli TaxID=2497877 RepID=UPI00101DD0D8|nr:RNA polymerase sigma factor [Peristeroidobacter soli]
MRWFKPRLLAPSCVEPDAGQGEAAAITQEELARIFVQIRPSLERVIERKTGNHQVAQDLAQEMFFRLQRVAHSLSKEEEARRYLMRMATNAAIDHLRVEGNRLQLLAGAIVLFDGHVVDPETQALMQERFQSIDSALSDLPPRCRDVLYLSRIEGLTHTEIADKLGVSRSLVEKYAVRAFLHCKRKLAQG